MDATEKCMESASYIIVESDLGDRRPQLTAPTYLNSTPGDEVACTSTARGKLSEQLRTAGRSLLQENQAQDVLPGNNDGRMTVDIECSSERPGGYHTSGFRPMPITRQGQTTPVESRGMADVSPRTVQLRETAPADMEISGTSLDFPESRGYRDGPRYRKPATYDGTTEWRDYLVYFEMVAELNQWSNRSRALELATSLRGAAQSVLSDLGTELRMSYRHLVSALQQRFAPNNQSELYRTQIKNRIREKDESVMELAQDVKRLVRLAYPAAPNIVREQLARDCFMDALNDTELEWAVFQGKAYTVTDAVRLALEYEAFQVGHRRRLGERSIRMQRGVTVDAESSRDGYMDRNVQAEILTRLAKLETGGMQTPRRGRNDPTRQYPGNCHFCGEDGHWRQFCPKRITAADARRQSYIN
jgi:hypothetical protein